MLVLQFSPLPEIKRGGADGRLSLGEESQFRSQDFYRPEGTYPSLDKIS
jgi:hypothetical protein